MGADWYLLTYFFAIILVYLANKYIQNDQYLLISDVLLFAIVSVFQGQLLNELSVFILRILLAYSLIVSGISSYTLYVKSLTLITVWSL